VEINFLNTRSVIVFVCLLQGVIFAALLFWRGRREKSQADFWLAALLLLLCSSLITPFIGFANVYTRNQWLTFFPFHIAYSWGVCVYFYVLSLTNSERKFTRRDLLLFVPSAVYVIFRLVLFTQSVEFKDWFDDNYYVPLVSPVVFVSEFAWNSVFLLLSLKYYRRYRRWLDENFSDTEQIKFDWLKNFLYVFTFVFILAGVFDFTDRFVYDLSYVQYFYFEIVLALVTYYLAVAGYSRLAPAVKLRFAPPVESPPDEIIETLSPKQSIAEPEFERLKVKLQNLMTDEKPHLEPQLTLADLSKLAGTNAGVLSAVINQGFGVNFNDFINGYRVEEVKARLENGGSKNLNLLGVAFECGFNSKATFNRVFKKQTGISPKEYLGNIEQVSNPPKTS
jgi:AraC-like DNA-binding protein